MYVCMYGNFSDLICNFLYLSGKTLKNESERIFILVLRYDYITVKRKICGNDDITWDCTCVTFSTLVSTADMEFGEVNWDGVLCCHCRLLRELSEKFLKLNLIIE